MKKRAFIEIILAGIFWGTSGLFVAYLAPFGLSSIQMTCIRGCTTAASVILYALFRDRTLFKVTLGELLLFLGSGVSMLMTATCYYASMQASSVSTAVVLMYTAPILVMAYSVAFLGEKLTGLKIVATICMMLGCVLVSGMIGDAQFNTRGVVLGLISGVTYSAYNIFTKIQMRKKSNPISANLYCFLFVSLFSLLISKPQQIITVAWEQSWIVVLAMVGCGICTCVLPYILYTFALKELPVGTASALGIIEPMAATIFSITLLGEQLTFYPACGIVLILGAVFLLSRGKG